MSYTFDPAAKLVRCAPGLTEVVLADLWSRYKDWVLAGHAEMPPALEAVGGDIPAIPLYLFPQNGWKIKLPEADCTVIVSGGVLVTADESDPFVNPDGDFVVRVEREAPGIAIGYATGGSSGPTTAAIAAAVVAAINAAKPAVNAQQINGAEVIGDGTIGNDWRGVGVPPLP